MATAVAFAVLLLSILGCGPAPQAVHEEHPAAEPRSAEAEAHSEERREERHERKERRREEREGREEVAPDRDDKAGQDRVGGGAASGGSAIPGGAYDLERDEQLGGHTLTTHVGRSDEQLRQRLEEEPNISAASTWTNVQIAETTVGAGLRDNAGRITEWEGRGDRRANLALHYDAGQEIGRSIRRGASAAEPCTAAVIVLKADRSGGFFVLTTYPEVAR